MEDFPFTTIFVFAYIAGVFIIGGISIAAILIFLKHADNRSVAVGVSTVYTILFALIVLTSFTTFIP